VLLSAGCAPGVSQPACPPTRFDGSQTLCRGSETLTNAATFDREVQPLIDAAEEFPEARRLLLSETPPRGRSMPAGIEFMSVWHWLQAHHVFIDGKKRTSLVVF
jgi:hypothetical protein